ncbi:hypothetical protein U2A4042460010 [Corynebacterium striatum]|nr:hypothetical protein U2A4042460010 [Corynebacterium striatum]
MACCDTKSFSTCRKAKIAKFANVTVLQLYRCRKAVKLHEYLAVLLDVFFEARPDNFTHGDSLTCGDSFEFSMQIAVHFDGHFLDVITA